MTWMIIVWMDSSNYFVIVNRTKLICLKNLCLLVFAVFFLMILTLLDNNISASKYDTVSAFIRKQIENNTSS